MRLTNLLTLLSDNIARGDFLVQKQVDSTCLVPACSRRLMVAYVNNKNRSRASEDIGTISLNVQVASGSSLAETDAIMTQIEEAIKDIPEISIYSKVSEKNARHD